MKIENGDVRHADPVPVQVYQGWAIFATYDAEAPDTEDLILCSTKELADQTLEILNKNPSAWGELAYVEGWEWKKRFCKRPSFNTDPLAFQKSLNEIFEEYEGKTDYEED